MAFAAGLRVIERSEAIAQLLDFLEFRLIGLMSRIVGQAVAFVVKTGRSFRRTGSRRGEDKTEDKTQNHRRDQECKVTLSLLRLFYCSSSSTVTGVFAVASNVIP